MTFAWYGHLKNLNSKPLLLVILISWGIAFFEYVLQVPANRIGFQYYDLGQLKIIQEIITMIVFAGFAILYMKQPLKLDFLWAALCMVGAVYFMFRSGLPQNV
ncbi:MAG: DMT family protein [Desulfosudis oleivorans]|nr:DMT family protein [Desulfosudis oleivorans]